MYKTHPDRKDPVFWVLGIELRKSENKTSAHISNNLPMPSLHKSENETSAHISNNLPMPSVIYLSTSAFVFLFQTGHRKSSVERSLRKPKSIQNIPKSVNKQMMTG